MRTELRPKPYARTVIEYRPAIASVERKRRASLNRAAQYPLLSTFSFAFPSHILRSHSTDR